MVHQSVPRSGRNECSCDNRRPQMLTSSEALLRYHDRTTVGTRYTRAAYESEGGAQSLMRGRVAQVADGRLLILTGISS